MNQIQLIALRICGPADTAGLTQEQVAERSGMTLRSTPPMRVVPRIFPFPHLFNIAETLGWIFPTCSRGGSLLRGYAHLPGQARPLTGASSTTTSTWSQFALRWRSLHRH